MLAAPAATTAKCAVISHATPDEIPDIVRFTKLARTAMFPKLDTISHSQHADRELAIFQKTYLDHPDGAYLVARVDGVLVATIAYVHYDYRFPHLHLGQERTVEVVRLYVEPAFRRTGLASRLFLTLEETARQQGIEQLYLHTHPFLPGAVSFWEKHGFRVMDVDEDPVWRTIHMRLLLDGRGHFCKV